ncbi:MAG: hypothetical protein NVS3B23_07550 [Candidatus Saccharimonadales bacterium]
MPPLTLHQVLPYKTIEALQIFSRPAARYSEASLVKKLEELGIGRPSTYAPTISTVQTRGYVEKGDLEGNDREVIKIKLEDNSIQETVENETYGADRNKLLPTSLADVTTDFLVKNFPAIVDFDFTATVENEFDSIAEGKGTWIKMIDDFYKNFHPMVEKSESISREESTQTRVLGKDPKTDKPIMARYGRYGPMLQRGETESEEKPAFAPLPASATLDTVTLEQALEMFKLPRIVGKTADNQDIKANIGRFGPYIQVDKIFVSIKGQDPLTISLEESLEALQKKLQDNADKNIQEFSNGIKIIKGPYGPYITDGKKNARINKTTDPLTLTEADCIALLAKAPAKKKAFRRKKTA